MLLMAIEARTVRACGSVHVFLDDARYHHAELELQSFGWLGRVAGSSCVSGPALLPAPGLDGTAVGVDASAYHPQQNATPRSGDWAALPCRPACARRCPVTGHHYCDAVTDNFRVVNTTEFRIIA